MSDACCGAGASVATSPTRLRDVAAIQAAGVAGVALIVGLVAAAANIAVLATAGFVGALIARGSTFLPHAARGVMKGRLGVGTLMAIAAIGAVLLGELAEAATLAFLFSIAEALEGYAVARTRQGLRALLDLVPPQATVVADGGFRVVAAGAATR